jgi:hypothetical protein
MLYKTKDEPFSIPPLAISRQDSIMVLIHMHKGYHDLKAISIFALQAYLHERNDDL